MAVHPKVIVNCAMSLDGKIASRLRKQVRLSDEEDMARVHRLRNDCDAILVGIGTVLADDPSLLVKDKYVDEVKQPIRIILDPHCRIPENSKVLDGCSSTLVIVTDGHARELPSAEVITCGTDELDLQRLMEILEEINVSTLLVEGGGETIWRFVKAGLVDKFIVFISWRIIGGKDAPTPVDGVGFAGEEEFVNMELNRSTLTKEGIILEFDT